MVDIDKLSGYMRECQDVDIDFSGCTHDEGPSVAFHSYNGDRDEIIVMNRENCGLSIELSELSASDNMCVHLTIIGSIRNSSDFMRLLDKFSENPGRLPFSNIIVSCERQRFSLSCTDATITPESYNHTVLEIDGTVEYVLPADTPTVFVNGQRLFVKVPMLVTYSTYDNILISMLRNELHESIYSIASRIFESTVPLLNLSKVQIAFVVHETLKHFGVGARDEFVESMWSSLPTSLQQSINAIGDWPQFASMKNNI